MLVVLPTAVLALATLGWLVGFGPTAVLPAAFAISLACVAIANRRQLSSVLGAAILLLVFAAGSGWLAARSPDLFFDSQLYHLPASFALTAGWSPLRDPDACEWRTAYCVPHPGVDHYPKGAWVFSAALYAWTGIFEAGKAAQLLTLLAAWIASVQLLLRFGRGPPLATGLAASLLALNPIAIEQAGSAYVDGWLASALLLFTVLLLDFVFHGRRRSLVLAALSLPLLVNLKFTGIPYAGVAAIAVGCIAFRMRPDALRPLMLGLGTAGALAIFGLGFHPYATNWLATGNPFHPALRSEGPSILSRMAAPEFIERDRFSRFVIAQVSRSREDDYRAREWVTPFTGWRVTPLVDDRYSGFGEPFAGALLLALFALARSRDPTLLILAGAIAVSIFVTEAGWWARLAPQAWWLAPLGVLAAGGTKRAGGVLAGAISALLLYTIVATTIVSGANAVANERAVSEALSHLATHEAVVVPDRAVGPVRAGFAVTLRQRALDAGQRVRVTPDPPGPCMFERRFLGASLCFLRPLLRPRLEPRS